MQRKQEFCKGLELQKLLIYNTFMQIPATVRALLWEYSLGEIPEERWQSTIIERVMQRGCWDDMWVDEARRREQAWRG